MCLLRRKSQVQFIYKDTELFIVKIRLIPTEQQPLLSEVAMDDCLISLGRITKVPCLTLGANRYGITLGKSL